MRYSLLSRFQGVLLGAALGERLGSESQRQEQVKKKTAAAENIFPLNRVALQRRQPDRDSQPQAVQSVSTAFSSGKLAVYYAKELIHHGGRNAPRSGQLTSQIASLAEQHQSPLNHDSLAVGAQLAIATLPIALFFHDDEFKLQQMLCEAASVQGYSDFQSGALAIGFAIAQALKEQLAPLHLIPRTIAYLQQEITPTDEHFDLINKLEQGQTLLQEGSNLSNALKTLLPSQQIGADSGAIALAFFCFLSTPEDMRLAMLRAARSVYLPQIVCALTGALSGAFNSTAGIPLEWSLVSSDPSQILDWQISGPEICQLAARLLAVWSGAYDPTSPIRSLAIAAPGIIRPR